MKAATVTCPKPEPWLNLFPNHLLLALAQVFQPHSTSSINARSEVSRAYAQPSPANAGQEKMGGRQAKTAVKPSQGAAFQVESRRLFRCCGICELKRKC